MQQLSTYGYPNTSTSSHEITAVPSMAYFSKASCGHIQKGYKGFLPIWQSRTLCHGLPRLSPVQIQLSHFVDKTMSDFTITIGISHTPFYHFILWTCVSPIDQIFVIRFEIGNIGDVLKHDYSWERVTSPIMPMRHCYTYFSIL